MSSEPAPGAQPREALVQLQGRPADYDRLIDAVGKRRLVLIGDGTHGTQEFYLQRAEITKRLVVEKGFGAVAVEADWPDAYRVDRYVQLESEDAGVDQALSDFQRFPTWMWRNHPVAGFVEWLRMHNESLPRSGPGAGFYGLDLYSLQRSIEAVIDTLQRIDPAAARRARQRYACFGQTTAGQEHGWAAALTADRGCEEEAVGQLLEMQRREFERIAGHQGPGREESFYALQNARVVQNAERYYRAMLGPYSESWNIRDTHMADTIDALLEYLRSTGRPDRVVVWEHNSHLGDARATERVQAGEINVGQLVRERHRDDCLLVGFTTHSGSVTAASDWDLPPQTMPVAPALAGSQESVLHELGGNFLLLTAHPGAAELARPRLERFIGVVYRPESERSSHYFHAELARQFDAVVHLDRSSALMPLDIRGGPEAGKIPETFPSKL